MLRIKTQSNKRSEESVTNRHEKQREEHQGNVEEFTSNTNTGKSDERVWPQPPAVHNEERLMNPWD